MIMLAGSRPTPSQRLSSVYQRLKSSPSRGCRTRFLAGGGKVCDNRFYSSTTLTTFTTQHRFSPVTLGVLRENYDKWERRTPLTPAQCQNFLSSQQQHVDSQIIVQPSSHRIFSNAAYQQAGAIVQEDLSSADIILGVKRPQSLEHLPSEKTYLFFSHVIKGQPENMGLLQEILNKKIQLIDYEKITMHNPTTGKEQRLVAFGRFAGLAGMVDTFSILGQRLLRQSWSTPFLNVAPTIYHSSLEDAKRAVSQMGDKIAYDGLPEGMPPIIFGMTGGPRGSVYQGVREIFDGLPHEMVNVQDLSQVCNERSGSTQSEYKIYGVAPEMKDLYIRNDVLDASVEQVLFDRTHFMQHSELYDSRFATTIAPYLSVFINSIFWDYRFPRLLSKQEIKDLYQSGNERLLVISDLSCDIGGSVEFLHRSTTIDRPVFQYDPIIEREVADSVQDDGITIFGVDILPTELPKESSEHFGNALQQVMPELVNAVTLSCSDATRRVEVAKLSQTLAKAVITTHDGQLANDFKYLDPIMKRTPKTMKMVEANIRTMLLLLEGHLFDSGLINQVLDVLEVNHCAFEFLECNVQYRAKGESPIKSTALLKISTDDEDVNLDQVEKKVKALVDAIVTADAGLQRLDRGGRSMNRAYVVGEQDKTVLLLGSGRVSRSVVDYLGRNKNRKIIVAGNDKNEAKDVAALAQRGRHATIDISNDPTSLQALMNESDIVISLLPAPLHPRVADMCIESKVGLVTASYESPEMHDMEVRARAAGVKILNEVGLDPGLDHMSAMKMIHQIKDQGGRVISFSSVCGGLPAPEVAEDNPLHYKFSWSPRGVLSASQNDAQFLWEGRILQVPGNELLSNAAPFAEAWQELHLECLPNRNSLHYRSIYGLEDASTIFRGTLRYRGFSSLLYVLKTMGYFDDSLRIDNIVSWDDLLGLLNSERGGFATIEDFILACANDDNDEALRAKKCLEWLQMVGPHPIDASKNDRFVVDLFCRRLEECLAYGDTERDMVCMHHTIGAEFDDGTLEKHYSSLQTFGTEVSMTAMCKTVGYPAAMAADLILDGLHDSKPGLLLPTTKEIYLPILSACEKEGIVFEEHVKVERQGRSSDATV